MPILLLLLLLPLSLSAQALKGEWLVWLHNEAALEELCARYQVQAERLVPEIQIWRLYSTAPKDDAALLQALQKHPQVQFAQYNHPVQYRSRQPNDSLFTRQWQYLNPAGIDLDADSAWALTTGGLSRLGDTLVVAVLDDGLDLQHPDWGNNLWVNRAEIPQNGLDDDGNGYVDDYLGWNTTLNSDAVGGGSHGSSVAGIIGAAGNNGRGVTGVNWNIKLMIIRNQFNLNEAEVIRAYGYALQQRRRYNRSGGSQGAFVVATNASWGIDRRQAEEAPLWCAFYDTLGQAGILNIGATTNSNTNVDLLGDLPTACPSPYLVGVTNLDRFGNKVANAGFGQRHIDLGAPGDGCFTLRSGNSYGSFGGTSAATPHVTGVVALMYAYACENFLRLSRQEPHRAALLMRQALLQGTVPNSSLQNRSSSGGQLNAYRALKALDQICQGLDCLPPLQVQWQLAEGQALVHWARQTPAASVGSRIRLKNGIWEDAVATMDTFMVFTQLLPCLEYEIELWAICPKGNSDTLRLLFEALGCCHPPQFASQHQRDSQAIQVHWQPVWGSASYQLRYREANETLWRDTLTIADTFYRVSSLLPCTRYVFELRTQCLNSNETPFSAPLSLQTLGCTDCSGLSYCPMQGNSSQGDYLQSLSLNGQYIASGNNGGYWFCDSCQWTLQAGSVHSIEVEQANAFLQYLVLWIDLNQDGDFEDNEEQIWSDTLLFSQQLNGQFWLPANAYPGWTKMRLALRWEQWPRLCLPLGYGEVEDYCVLIQPPTGLVPTAAPSLRLYPNPSHSGGQLESQGQVLGFVQIFNSLGQLVWEAESSSSSLPLPQLAPGSYWIRALGQSLSWIHR